MSEKETIRAALRQYRGDNLERAQAEFRNLTPTQMKKQIGDSRLTRAGIVAEYQAHVDRVEAALRWLEAQP